MKHFTKGTRLEFDDGELHSTFHGRNDGALMTKVESGSDSRDAQDVAEEVCAIVNMHQELVEALREAYAHVTLLGSGQRPPCSNAEMCDKLGAALAKAGVS